MIRARVQCDASIDIRSTAMHALKQEALDAISKLPEDTDMDEIMYRLYVLDKIRKGQEAVNQGRTIRSEDLEREIDSW
jgi:predicted transcriptional regulator